MSISVFVGLPGSGKSTFLIQEVCKARSQGRPTFTFASTDNPHPQHRAGLRALACRRPDLSCTLDYFVSTAEACSQLEALPEDSLAVFDEAYRFRPQIAESWARASEKGVEVMLATPSGPQRQVLGAHGFTETSFSVQCQSCGANEATSAIVLPDDSTLALCQTCDLEKTREARAEIVRLLHAQGPYPGESVIYQPVELSECADWRVLRPDSSVRAELMATYVRDAIDLPTLGRWQASYLDVGCNTGYFCGRMAQLGLAAVGVDVARGDIAVARLLEAFIRRTHSKYEASDAFAYLSSTQDQQFDVTSAFSVMQWVAIQTSMDRAVDCMNLLFAKTRVICFFEMGYGHERHYQDKLPAYVDRGWTYDIMKSSGQFRTVKMIDGKHHDLMWGARDLFIGIR